MGRGGETVLQILTDLLRDPSPFLVAGSALITSWSVVFFSFLVACTMTLIFFLMHY